MGSVSKLLVSLSLMMVILSSTIAASYFTNVRVERVIDGDTIVVSIDDLPAVFGKKLPVRLAGIDTPELNGRCENERVLAQKALDRLNGIIMKANRVDIANAKRGKFFRIVGTVRVDGIDVSSTLIAEGLARIYDGGSRDRAQWCDYRKTR